MALNNAQDSGGDGVKPNELFIAGSYWVSHKNLDHFDSDKLVGYIVETCIRLVISDNGISIEKRKWRSITLDVRSSSKI